MTEQQLYTLLEMPSEAVEALNEAEGKLNLKELAAPIAALTDPMRYDMARKDLEQQLSDDPKGWKILRCMFAAMVRTYEHYQKAGISEQTFADTMKCFPRFVREHKECFGDYGFDRAFWPGRQLSMLLFRLGALEFELIPEAKTDDEVPEKEAVRAFHLPVKEIGVHIPSDADISPARVQISFMLANMFFAKHVPQAAVCRYTCESWMMSPALQGLLPQTSRILQFQKHFTITHWEKGSEEDCWQWVFRAAKDCPLEHLPENTSLQRSMKEYLKNGGAVGVAEAVWDGSPFFEVTQV